MLGGSNSKQARLLDVMFWSGMLLVNHGYAVLGCEKGREGSEEHEE